MIRATVLSVTAICVWFLWKDRPTPVKAVQVDYCVIDFKAAAKDPFGNWQSAWVQGYGMCSLQDKYFNI